MQQKPKIPADHQSQERGLGQILPHSSQKEPTLLTTWSWTSGLQSVRHYISVVLATQFVVLCYSSPNQPLHPAGKVWISPGLWDCHLQIREGTLWIVMALLNEPESRAHTLPRQLKDWQHLPLNGKTFKALPGKAVEIQSDRNSILSRTHIHLHTACQ